MGLSYRIIASRKTKKQKESEPTRIYLRYYDKYSAIDWLIRTPLKVYPNLWKQKQQRVRDYNGNVDTHAINENLFNLKKHMNDFLLNKFEVQKDEMEKEIFKFFGQAHKVKRKKSEGDDQGTTTKTKVFLTDYFKWWIDNELPKRGGTRGKVSTSTVTAYTTTLNNIKKYEQHNDVRIRFNAMDDKFMADFKEWYTGEQENTNNSLVSSIVAKLKVVYKDGFMKDNEISLHPDFHAMGPWKRLAKEKNVQVYLTLEEQDLIKSYDYYSINPELQFAADWLLLGCNTGMAFRELDGLTMDHFDLKNGVISNDRQKTSVHFACPINHNTLDILKKYNMELPPKPKSINQGVRRHEWNTLFKDVCEYVGIDTIIYTGRFDENGQQIKKAKYDMVKVHTGRRSFATNLMTMYDSKDIMVWGGWTTAASFMRYNKMTAIESVLKFKEKFQENYEKHRAFSYGEIKNI